MALPTGGLAPLHQLVIMEMSLEMSTGQCGGGNFSVDFPCSQMTLSLCQVDIYDIVYNTLLVKRIIIENSMPKQLN